MGEGATGGEAPATGLRDVVCGERRDILWNAHADGGGIDQWSLVGRRRDRERELSGQRIERRCIARGIHRPRDHKAVGRHVTLEGRVGGIAVHRRDELVDPRPHPVEVEVRVARDQGIVCPVDRLDSEPPAGIALIGLEAFAEVLSLCGRVYGEHIRPVDQFSVPNPGDPEDEAHQSPVIIEGAGDDAPGLRRDQEHRGGDLLGESCAPGQLLESDAGGAVGVGGEVADVHGC